MRKRRYFTAAVPRATMIVVSIVMLGMTSGAEARIVRHCGQVGSSAGWGYGDIRAYGVTCRTARQVIRADPAPRGWHFSHHGERDWWRHGSRVITGRPLGD